MVTSPEMAPPSSGPGCKKPRPCCCLLIIHEYHEHDCVSCFFSSFVTNKPNSLLILHVFIFTCRTLRKQMSEIADSMKYVSGLGRASFSLTINTDHVWDWYLKEALLSVSLKLFLIIFVTAALCVSFVIDEKSLNILAYIARVQLLYYSLNSLYVCPSTLFNRLSLPVWNCCLSLTKDLDFWL